MVIKCRRKGNETWKCFNKEMIFKYQTKQNDLKIKMQKEIQIYLTSQKLIFLIKNLMRFIKSHIESFKFNCQNNTLQKNKKKKK